MRVNGWVLFAAIMMVLSGTMGAIAGLVAIIDDEVIVVTGERIVAFDATEWGWIHLIIGVIVVLAGFALVQGALWARIIAVVMAGASALSQIAWIDVYPFWSLAIIAIDVIVIYAVCTMGRPDAEVDFSDMTATPDTSGGGTPTGGSPPSSA